ncbi:hypothetical protein C8Q75DRAFT_733938 [Abortiporus biennis]|nr:hypothetical protein C8Q75DRAFT_733938 [Abortiporus biennis]
MSPPPTPPGNVVDVLGGPFQKQKEDGAQRSRILWPGEYIQVLDAGKPILAENKPQHKEKQVVRIMRAEDYHKPFPSPVPKDIKELKEMLSEANRSLRHADRLI